LKNEVYMKLLYSILFFAGVVSTPLWSMEYYREAQSEKAEISGEGLEKAIKRGKVDKVKSLLNEGISPHASGRSFKSHPMILAAGLAVLPACSSCKERHHLSQKQAKKIIKLLMKYTSSLPSIEEESQKFLSSLNARNKGAYTRFEDNIAQDIKKLIDETLEGAIHAGSEVNKKDREGKTLLHKAARENNVEFVQDLINAGADVNVRDRDDTTPLHEAADSGAVAAIEPLVKAGAKIDAEDRNGDTPLHKAMYNNKPEAAQMLIELGASVNKQNKAGKMPLELAQELPDKTILAKIDEADKECSLCLDEFSEDVPETVTVCKHRFHKHCLDESRVKLCPMCRHQLEPESEIK
jgi:ankyrin repeat protein